MHPNSHRQDASHLLKTLDSVLLSSFIYQNGFLALLSAFAGTLSTKAAETVWYLDHSNNPSKLLGQGKRDSCSTVKQIQYLILAVPPKEAGEKGIRQAVPWFYLTGYQRKSFMPSRTVLNNDYLQTSIKWKNTLHRLQELGLLHLGVVVQLWPAKKLSPKHTS